MIHDFKNLSEDEIIKLIKSYELWFEDLPIEHQTEKISLEAVKLHGIDIRYVKNPTKLVKLEAIRQDGSAIKYINNPTEEMKLQAIRKYCFSLQYIKEQTLDLCIMAVKKDKLTLEFVNENLLDKVLEHFSNIKLFKCKNRVLIAENINNKWLFTIGCQKQINKEIFINRIKYHAGGLKYNPHRQEYLKILEQF